MATGAPHRPGLAGRWPARAATAGLLGLLGLGLVAWALLTNRTEFVWPGRTAAVGPRLHTIVTNADSYYGRDVSLDGRVGRVVAPRAFTVQQGDDELLVVAPYELPPAPGQPTDRPLAAGDPVGVTGTVRAFDLPFVQRDVGYDLDPAVFQAWEHRPALVALWVDRSPSA